MRWKLNAWRGSLEHSEVNVEARRSLAFALPETGQFALLFLSVSAKFELIAHPCQHDKEATAEEWNGLIYR
ncbi:unnamed protein product [Strongylus vulgaris]|uniref:Uncharacterized protein n=1 Tax=Strongylus vulgaris TaxID=40348 RepID=A0A3P7JAW5_STRVU|nr:unnamed protein product [Strongylus vulgaris]